MVLTRVGRPHRISLRSDETSAPLAHVARLGGEARGHSGVKLQVNTSCRLSQRRNAMRLSYLLFAGILVLTAAGLAACGGGGSGTPPTVTPPVDPVDPDDPVDPAEPPVEPNDPITQPPSEPYVCKNGATDATNPALCERGRYSIKGIDKIPLDQVRVTNKQMQRMFVITDIDLDHAGQVGLVACESYVTRHDCNDRATVTLQKGGALERRDGTTPFTQLLFFDSRDDPDYIGDILWLTRQIQAMGTAKIVMHPREILGSPSLHSNNEQYLTVLSAGNGTDNFPWFDEFLTAPQKEAARKAMRDGNLIIVAGYDRDEYGNYIRHADSNSCLGADEGCLWTRMDFLPLTTGTGTSFSAPQFASALASVLAVFRETTHQNLAEFGKACTKKSGEGIEQLLRESGGLGVADFECMGSVVAALANLPTGGQTNVSVKGQNVSVGRDQITLSLTQSDEVPSMLRQEEDGFSYLLIPTGDGLASAILLQKEGDTFASLTFGIQDDFFGFSDGHHGVFAAEVAAGHENAFVRFSQQRSSGGTDIRHAKGRAMGITLQKEFSLSESTVLTAQGDADRFLGGSAAISFGDVNLPEGEWQYRLHLRTETKIDESSDLSFSAHSFFPPSSEREDIVKADYRIRF